MHFLSIIKEHSNNTKPYFHQSPRTFHIIFLLFMGALYFFECFLFILIQIYLLVYNTEGFSDKWTPVYSSLVLYRAQHRVQ